MMKQTLIKDYAFEGVLAEHCANFVAEKRAVGHLYNTEAKHMYRFSRFSTDFEIPKDTLPDALVHAWIERQPTDSDRNYYSRFALIKLFAEYMHRLGYEAYCPSKDDLGKIQWTYIPYIFTHDEIRRFFAAADAMELKTRSIAPRRHLVMPVLFRLLYCCGLRVSEATGLLMRDVDLDEGILTIRDSKFGRTRYVPMSSEITMVCGKYAQGNPYAEDAEGYFFPAPDGGGYDERSVYHVFRELLWNADISHGGRGKGPRVHDFRHTFAVHFLEKWQREGKELTIALPRLSAYLGHNDITATERYLRMPAEVYPEISALLSEKYGHLIPKGGDMG